MWIVRNCNRLYWFIDKPIKFHNNWATYRGLEEFLKSDLFPEITEDSEPVWKRFIRPEWIDEICG